MVADAVKLNQSSDRRYVCCEQNGPKHRALRQARTHLNDGRWAPSNTHEESYATLQNELHWLWLMKPLSSNCACLHIKQSIMNVHWKIVIWLVPQAHHNTVMPSDHTVATTLMCQGRFSAQDLSLHRVDFFGMTFRHTSSTLTPLIISRQHWKLIFSPNPSTDNLQPNCINLL